MSHRTKSWILVAVLVAPLLLLVHLVIAAAQVPNCVSGCGGGGPTEPAEADVTPDAGSTNQPPGGNGLVYAFTIQNIGPVSGSWTLSCHATGGVSCVSLLPTTVSLAVLASQTVTVSFNLTSVSGTLTLVATGTLPATLGDSGWVTVVPDPTLGAPVVSLRNPNGDNLDRGLCLTAGAGEAAAYQCGDLLVTHALPSYSTLGRDRALTMVYTSAQAAPQPVVALAVGEGGTAPTTVYAELQVNEGAGLVTKSSATYAGWSSTTRQVALSWNATADTSDNSGVYPFQMLARNQFGAAAYTSAVTGNLILVDRGNSRLGKGWSLAGVERLYFNQPVSTGAGGILWVGGDGSARLYGKLTATTWVAPPGAFRDTLVFSSGTQTYTRTLHHGVKVVFDALGRHIQTVNRAGHTTAFYYSGTTTRLDSLAVPPVGRPGTVYKLVYTVAGKVDSIADPAGRAVRLGVVSGGLNTIRDPDPAMVTSFQYDATGRMLRRTSARGFGTGYAYNGPLLTLAREPYGIKVSPDSATTLFTSWSERGLPVGTGTQTAVDTGTVFTVIRGPRYPTVADTARFSIDRWGAPTKIVNALGQTTLIARADTARPALTTRITYPNTRVVMLTWDSRANLLTQTDSTVHVDGRANRTSTWVYASPNTKDSPTQIKDPLLRTTTFVYDSLGLTQSVTDPRAHQTTLTLFAVTTGTQIKGLPSVVAEKNVATWWAFDSTDHVQDQTTTFGYDTLGNVRSVRNPVGVVTTYVRDGAARVTNVYGEIIGTTGVRQELLYDAMSRVRESRGYAVTAAAPTYGLTPQCASLQLLCADSAKAWDGLPSMLATRYFAGAAGVDSILDPRNVKRGYLHDARGATYGERDEADSLRTVFPNAAGLPDSARSRSGQMVYSTYDVLGRRTALRYPAVAAHGLATVRGDTLTSTYDAMGNLATAHNHEGTITQNYFADGALKEQISALTNGLADTLRYTYDAAGAATQVVHGRDSTLYHYNAAGDLDSLTAAWGAWGTHPAVRRVFAFRWDSLGRRRQVIYPTDPVVANRLTVTYSYDGLGVLRRVTSSRPTGPNVAARDVFNFTFRNEVVDAGGRVLHSMMTCSLPPFDGNPCGTSYSLQQDNSYNRFSALVRQVTNAARDSMRYDASGSLITRRHGTQTQPDSFVVAAGRNRMTSIVVPGGKVIGISYTGDGARTMERGSTSAQWSPTDHLYFYDGLGRTSGSAYWTDINGTYQWLLKPEQCRYDALGRMVGPCDDSSPFLSFDGANTSGTLVGQAGNMGDGWRFVHGPGLDDPLTGLFRQGTQSRVLYWVTDGQGRQLAVADSSGFRAASDGYVDQSTWRYAGGTQSSSTFGADRFSSTTAPGLSFFRNRVYDQATGRWTQEDPLGVAGGVNLYQFNGNNPVAYTDPFGLCPPKDLSEVFLCTGQLLQPAEKALNAYAVGIAVVSTGGMAAVELSAGAGLTTIDLSTARGSVYISNGERALLRDFFGKSIEGAKARLADFKIPEGLSLQTLRKYGKIAARAIARGADELGTQAMRLELIKRAMSELTE